MEPKSTNKELVDELTRRNVNGRYDQLIEKAKSNLYHEYKSALAAPKVQLVADLQYFPELQDIIDQVFEGNYEEKADEADIQEMREDLIKDDSPDAMFEMLGFKAPSPQERAFVKAKSNFHNKN